MLTTGTNECRFEHRPDIDGRRIGTLRNGLVVAVGGVQNIGGLYRATQVQKPPCPH